MQPDNQEQQPQDQDQPFTSSRPSRDTLLLLGALAFLILAIALTFFFQSFGGTGPQAPTTSVAISEDTPTGTPATPVSPLPGATTDLSPEATIYPGPATQPPFLPSPSTGYPFPAAPTSTAIAVAGSTLTPEVTAYPGPPSPVGTPPLQPTITLGFPTFAPVRPTATNDPGAGFVPPTATPTNSLNNLQQTDTPTIAPIVPTPQPTLFRPTATPPPPLPPDPGKEPPPTVPTEPPAAAPDVDVLSGNIRWRIEQSPIILQRDVQLAPGSTLTIEPGVEVRLGPGVAFYVDGAQFLALGRPEQPIRIIGNSGIRWKGLYVRPGSYTLLEDVEVRGGGAGGTMMVVDQSEAVIRRSRFNENGGIILMTDTKIEMRDSEIAGNDMPYGAALDLTYTAGNFVTLGGNRIGGNRLSGGSPSVRISSQSAFDTLILDIQGNLLRGGVNNLLLSTNGLLQGNVACNTMIGDDLGFSLRTQTVQVGPNGTLTMDLHVNNNFIDQHTPPIIPIYLKYGLGRGAASEIALDMSNNWWGDASGPYDPEFNPEGRGDSVGDNILYEPWLTEAPSCAPPK